MIAAERGLAGAATGCRTFTGLAALAPAGPDTSNGCVKGLTALLATQELVIDKLPRTASRLEPLGLGIRCTAAAAGLIIARRTPGADDQAKTSRQPPKPPARGAAATSQTADLAASLSTTTGQPRPLTKAATASSWPGRSSERNRTLRQRPGRPQARFRIQPGRGCPARPAAR